ncbi:MAG TPA: MATE family efflux transporter [Candidatus Binatia bacterium]
MSAPSAPRTPSTLDERNDADEHAFVRHPHRTMLALSFPVLLSLIAEPLTGLADTAFVARLGATPLAALGVATVLLSSIFWVFNFLGIGTQTAVARAHGGRQPRDAAEAIATALLTALVLGTTLAIVAWPFLDALVQFMGAGGELRADAIAYLRIRFLGAPAVLVTIVAFGALRGVQDMRTPLRIAVAVNVANVILDALLIFGAGPVPALGVAGAAWATTVSQVAGAVWAVLAARRVLGPLARVRLRGVLALLVVGRDLVLRTGLLLLFVLLATRAATLAGPDSGAAHQAIRQVWMLTALVLDAYAATAQTLVGYFLGARRTALARRVAAVGCRWGVATGVLLAVAMLASREQVAWLLVPTAAQAAFASAWTVAALAQPLNALSFVTDGVHWGTGDFRWLRNAMLLATASGAVALAMIDVHGARALLDVWLVTAAWIAIRAAFGIVRVWPGVGSAPLARF